MPAKHRTIYTQGEIKITRGAVGSTEDFATVSGVQNASFSFNSARKDVNAFGFKGALDKVQVEPETASITFSYILPVGTGVALDLSPTMINKLIENSIDGGAPTGYHVEAKGIGAILSGVLTSLSASAKVGDLATLELTFEGTPSGNFNNDSSLPPEKAAPIKGATYQVVTPDLVSGFANATDTDFDGAEWSSNSNSSQNFGACVRNAEFKLEVPVERILCLGEGLNQAVTFTNPPGTSSITLEGIDMPSGITGFWIGQYGFAMAPSSKVTSRQHNMAVGEVASTYNVTIEGTADGCVVKSW